MPYIPQADRGIFANCLADLQGIVWERGLSNGELNYLMTCLAQIYLQKHGTSYNTISDVIKAFECAKLEFYRRVAAPYEDKKALANGDICYAAPWTWK